MKKNVINTISASEFNFLEIKEGLGLFPEILTLGDYAQELAGSIDKFQANEESLDFKDVKFLNTINTIFKMNIKTKSRK